MSTTGIYKVTWGGPGRITWEKLSGIAERTADLPLLPNIAPGLNVGLGLVGVVQNQMILHAVKRIEQDTKNIKARFDLLFLDRSIDHFLACHNSSLGVNTAAASALLEDCLNALSQLASDQTLYVPGYLRHRVASLAESVSQFNRLHYALLHNGKVNVLEEPSLKRWVSGLTSLAGSSPDGGYAPQALVISSWNQELSRRSRERQQKSFIESLSKKQLILIDEAVSAENLPRTQEVATLFRELEICGRYVDQLSSILSKDAGEIKVAA